MEEKQIILKKLKNNPDLSLKTIAESLGLSQPSLLRRMKDHGIKHGRKRGVKLGTRKPLKPINL